MTRWRTCNNRRRRKLGHRGRWIWSSGWIVFDEAAHISPELWNLLSDQREYGIAITRDGERVDPNDFYLERIDPGPYVHPLDRGCDSDHTESHERGGNVAQVRPSQD